MQHRPEAVLFDLGDTVIEPLSYRVEIGVQAMLEAASHRNGATVEEVSELARGLNQDFERRANESSLEYSQRVFQRMLYDSFGIRFDRPEAELERIYWDNALEFGLEPGVVDALEAVRAAGLTTGVVSNSSFSGEVLLHELAKRGVAKYFDFLVSSADYGLRKPHPRIFRVGVRKAGVPATRTWYVGNSLELDVAGAAHVGMMGVWYNRRGLDGELPAGAAAITHWREFLPLMETAAL
jgi:putative hydrolase of the HAD superfamily